MFTARSFAKNAQDFASGLPTYPSKKLRVGFTPAGRLNWCTGKDSNLRTSLGGTDLQSVGFNHSPTCAKTFGRCGRRAPSGRLRFASAEPLISTDLCAAHITHLQFRQTGKPGSRKRQPRRSLHAGKRSEWSALEKPVVLLHRPSPAAPEIHLVP